MLDSSPSLPIPLAAEVVHLRVRGLGDAGAAGSPGAFRGSCGETWVPGQVTVTCERISFTPSRAPRRMPALDVDIDDVVAVEVGGEQPLNVAAVRTATHEVLLRGFAAVAVARCVARLRYDRAAATR